MDVDDDEDALEDPAPVTWQTPMHWLLQHSAALTQGSPSILQLPPVLDVEPYNLQSIQASYAGPQS